MVYCTIANKYGKHASGNATLLYYPFSHSHSSNHPLSVIVTHSPLPPLPQKKKFMLFARTKHICHPSPSLSIPPTHILLFTSSAVPFAFPLNSLAFPFASPATSCAFPFASPVISFADPAVEPAISLAEPAASLELRPTVDFMAEVACSVISAKICQFVI